MKLAVNIALSLLTLGVCLWLVWPSEGEREEMVAALGSMDFRYVLGCLALLPLVHYCRSRRWNNLLAPLGVELPIARLVAISSVGFMAILALPARLGEFVRPALIRKKGEISASAALGTIAVERVIDGLFMSLTVFFTFLSLRGPGSPSWMLVTAFTALGIFSAALVFLALALRWPEKTVNTAVTLTLARYYAPRLAEMLREMLSNMIRGFVVLRDRRNLMKFAVWTAAYWGLNGLSLWVLAQGFQGIDVPLIGAYAILGTVAVGIMIPNAPALVGQYTYFTMVGLSLSVGQGILDPASAQEQALTGVSLAYANLLYGIQLVWYIGMGGLALLTPYVSLTDIWQSRSMSDSEGPEPVPAMDADSEEAK